MSAIDSFETCLRNEDDWGAFKILIENGEIANDAFLKAMEMNGMEGNKHLMRMALVFGAKQSALKSQELSELANGIIYEVPYLPDDNMLDAKSRGRTTEAALRHKLKILSMDGGGVRGFAEIVMLEAVQKITKRPITETFDYITGTSTGGLLALNLLQGKSLRECAKMYIDLMEILKGDGPYDGGIMDTYLMKHYGDGTLHEEGNTPRVAIPTTRIGTTMCDVQLFRNYDSHVSTDDPDEVDAVPLCSTPCEVWKIARATSSIPLVIAPVTIGKYEYVDGGLVSNNPTINVLTDIERIYEHEACGERPTIDMVLSIGSGYEKSEPRALSYLKSWWLHPWNNVDSYKQILEILTTVVGQTNGSITTSAKYWTRSYGGNYERLNLELDEAIKYNCEVPHMLFDMMWKTQKFIYGAQGRYKHGNDKLKHSSLESLFNVSNG